MTANKARKRAVRERMAETGETYTQAARRLDNGDSAPQRVAIVADGHTGWDCPAGASLIAEATSPGKGHLPAHHGVIYVCADHRADAEARITAAGYDPLVYPAPPGHKWDPWPCGHITAYLTKGVAAEQTVQQLGGRPETRMSMPAPQARSDFGGHEFEYEATNDLFRCVYCKVYEVVARSGDGSIAPCTARRDDDTDKELAG